MFFQSKPVTLSVFLAFFVLSSAVQAQDASVTESLKAVSTNDQTCTETALDLAKSQADLAEDSTKKQTAVATIAGIATTQCSFTATSGIATSFAKEFPEDAVAIAVAMTKANPSAVAEIVLSIVTTFPEKRQQKKFEDIIAALKQEVPELANQESFAALSIPGAPPSPSAPAPAAGLLAFDVISPS